MSQATTEAIGRAGVLRMIVQCEHPERFEGDADHLEYVTLPNGSRGILLEHHNAYVRTGLRNSLLREFGAGGNAVGWIGVSSSASTVTENTRFLNGTSAGVPGSGGAGGNTVIKAFSPVATVTADSVAAQTATAGATFTNADFPGGLFVWNKVGLLSTSTDTDGGLVDVIGGTGGTAPYARTFSADYTNVGQFVVTPQIAVTATAI